MKQNGEVEDGSNTSATRIKPHSEENVCLHEKDPLDVWVSLNEALFLNAYQAVGIPNDVKIGHSFI
jgi:hypothetical protein